MNRPIYSRDAQVPEAERLAAVADAARQAINFLVPNYDGRDRN